MSYQALLFCSDEKSVVVVEKILSELDFVVSSCSEPFAAVKRITAEHFDALVVDCSNEQNAALLFKSARNSDSNTASLAVALVEGQAGIAKAFRIGANLVLSKPINVEQSKSTLRVARGLLKKAEATKSAPAPDAALPAAEESAAAIDTPQESLPAPSLSTELSNHAFARPSFTAALPITPETTPGLEIEAKEEPAPALGAAEAALLESMPAPIPLSVPDRQAPAKEPSWQSASKSFAGPAPVQPVAGHTAPIGQASAAAASQAPAQPISAPAPGAPAKSIAEAPVEPKPIPESVVGLYEPKSTSISSAGAAAAPAPAPAPKKTRESKPKSARKAPAQPAAKLHLDAGDHDAPPPAPEGNGRNLAIAAVLVLGLAGAGYFGWPRLQPAILSLGIVQKYLPHQQAPAPPPAPAPAPVPVSTAPPTEPATTLPATDGATPGTNPQPTGSPAAAASTAPASGPQVATPPAAAPEAVPTPAQQVPVQKNAPTPTPSGAKPSGRTPAPQPPAAAPASKAPSPIVVKSDAKKNAPIAAPAPQTLASPSSDKTAMAAVAPLMAKPGTQVIRVSQGVSNGLLLKRVAPVYPTLALQMRVEGNVDLDLTVTKDGGTSNIKVLRGDSMLAAAAVDAVRKWKYKPYVQDGQAVELQTQVTVNFKLPL